MNARPRISLISIACVALASLVLGAGLTLAQEGSGAARISGSVKDESGQPIADVVVHFEPAPGMPIPAAETTTSKKGKFTFANLPLGAYEVHVGGAQWFVSRVKFSTRGGADLSSVSGFDLEIAEGEAPAVFTAIRNLRASIEITVGERVAPEVTDEAVLHALAVEEAVGALQRLNELYKEADFPTLIEEANVVIAEDPDLGGAYYLRGVALWQTGSREQALPDLKKAAEFQPDQPGINGTIASLELEIGRAWLAEGREDEAIAMFNEAAVLLERQIQATPDSVVYRTNMVVALESAGRTDDSIEAIRALIVVDPMPQAYLRLADLLTEAGRPDEAVETLRQMPGAGSEAAIAIYNAAVELWNDGNMDATLTALDVAIEMDPQLPDLYRLKGRTLISKGEDEAGVEVLRHYLTLVPEDDPAADADRALVKALGG
jgi:tetratricopeptide (TPR) repeat protein